MNKSIIRFRTTRLSGFTLVELLVVMGIIAILAGVLLSAGGAALRAAKRAKASNTATQIQTAALAYYTEYGIYPVGTATTDSAALIKDQAANAAAWGSLLEALCGNIKPSTGASVTPSGITNSRGIAFLSMKATDVDANDAPLNPLPTGNSIYFNIAMDADYDGVLGVSTGTSPVTTMPNFSGTFSATGGGTSTAGVAVWANCNGVTTSTNGNFYVHTY